MIAPKQLRGDELTVVRPCMKTDVCKRNNNLLFNKYILFVFCFLFSGDEWYLCRLTLSMSSHADLQWVMFPSPHLTTVSPDATPGFVVYRLLARQRDGTTGQAQFLLLDGRFSNWNFLSSINELL